MLILHRQRAQLRIAQQRFQSAASILRLVAVAWMLGACDKSARVEAPLAPAFAAQDSSKEPSAWGAFDPTPGGENSAPAPFEHRTKLYISATGTFQPGRPITITLEAIGQRASQRTRLRMGAYPGPNTIEGDGLLLDTRVALSEGAVLKESRTYVFNEPGYYLIAATSQVEVIDEPRKEADRFMPLANENASQAWVLITSTGGHLDRVYDDSWTQIRNRYLQFGSLGAFRSYAQSLVSIGSEDASSKSSSTTAPFGVWPTSRSVATATTNDEPCWDISCPSDPCAFNNPLCGTWAPDPFQCTQYGQVTGATSSGATTPWVATIYRQDLDGAGIVPMRSVWIQGCCQRQTTGAITAYIAQSTTALGHFSYTCPNSTDYVVARAYLSSSTADVYGPSGANAGAPMYITPSIPKQFLITNNNAGLAFFTHQLYNDVAPAYFGASRGKIRYEVNNVAPQLGAYFSGSDKITFGAEYFGDGMKAVVTHEYGHAFHWAAIDNWVSTSGCVGNHFKDVPNTTGCAYKEGFADFFSALMRSHVDGSFSSIWFAPDSLENNDGRSLGANGVLVEARIASLMWDLVDGAFSPDVTPGLDDEGMSVWAAGLRNIMRNCRMYSPGTYLVSHSDQFVYCAEGTVNARIYAPTSAGWGYYGSLSFDAPTSLPPNPLVRQNWLYNLYNSGPTP